MLSGLAHHRSLCRLVQTLTSANLLQIESEMMVVQAHIVQWVDHLVVILEVRGSKPLAAVCPDWKKMDTGLQGVAPCSLEKPEVTPITSTREREQLLGCQLILGGLQPGRRHLGPPLVALGIVVHGA